MTTIEINVWALLLSMVASMVIGAIYYSDSVLGKDWKKLAKIDEKRYKRETPRMIPVIAFGALVTAFIVGVVQCYYEKFYVETWMHSGLVAALIIWVAVAASMSVHSALDQRPRKLLLITL